MAEDNKSFYTTIKTKKYDSIEVKSLMLQANTPGDIGKQQPHIEDSRQPWHLPIGPFVPIKNKDPPIKVEEQDASSY